MNPGLPINECTLDLPSESYGANAMIRMDLRQMTNSASNIPSANENRLALEDNTAVNQAYGMKAEENMICSSS